MTKREDAISRQATLDSIDEFIRQQREYTEKTLAEIITNYDFLVGSKECKCRLMEILPEGASIICSPYIESPTMIYAIKKFDTMDLLFEPQKRSDKESCDKCKHFKVLYEPLRTTGELWDMGRARCDKHDYITDFANHGKFKRLDTCEDFEPQESEG